MMPEPRRGEIWQGDFDPTRGREQAGPRPMLVISTDSFGTGPAELVVVLPITSKLKGIGWHVEVAPSRETGLKTTSYVMCEAIRCISHDRLSKFLGIVDPALLKQVEKRLRILLEL